MLEQNHQAHSQTSSSRDAQNSLKFPDQSSANTLNKNIFNAPANQPLNPKGKNAASFPVKVKRFRLRTALVVPFIVQLVAAVGIIEYLSFRNSQRAVNDLVTQLSENIAQRIEQHTKSYLEAPQRLQRNTQVSVETGQLDLNEPEQIKRYFIHQLKAQDQFTYFFYGDEKGNFIGVQEKKDKLIYKVRDRSTNQKRITYELNDQQQPGKFIEDEFFDPRTRPWYKAAQEAGKPGWSPIYISFTQSLLRSDAVLPIYGKKGEFLGAFSIEVTLEQISKFLRSLYISSSGETFIIERQSGYIVASSTQETPFTKTAIGEERLLATDSQEPIIQATSEHLLKEFQGFKSIQKFTNSTFNLKDEKYLVSVSPFSTRQGLDWLIVVVVPEADFMAQIHEHTQHTIFLCSVALIIAIAIGIITSRLVIWPILRASEASEAIASGQLNQSLPPSPIIEIEKLVHSFNSMSHQLNESFATLEHQRNSFARFFPVEYLQLLQKTEVTQVDLGDHVSKEMAVMFSDIRSFTSLSEKMTPKETFDFVNEYLQRMSPEIRNHNGFVIKFLGDGVMAAFPNGADDAVQAGIAKFQQLQTFNQEREKAGLFLLKIGIGIHIGHLMVGMVGEENRVQPDALSDNVNLTARLEGLTKYYGVSLLISEQVLQKLQSSYQIRPLDRVIVKGRTEAIAIYEVLDAEIPQVRDLKLQTLPDFQLGLNHYRAGQLAEAQSCFEQVYAINPADKTCQLYLDRIRQLMEQGLPQSWNGIWEFTQK